MCCLGLIFLLVDLREICFRFRVGGGGGGKKSSENDQLTGWSFSELFFFNIFSKKKVKLLSKVNQQSVLNLYIFHHFPKNLDRTITFNSATPKNTQTEPQKNIIISTKQMIFRVSG